MKGLRCDGHHAHGDGHHAHGDGHHAHGGNIDEIAREFDDMDARCIKDFSANINPLGMSLKAKEAAIKALESAENYPDNEQYELIRELSRYHSMPRDGDHPPENILAGNGSTEFIYLIPQIFKPKRALIVSPAFSEYERSLLRAGCRTEFFHLKEEDNFKLHLPLLSIAMRRGVVTGIMPFDILWIANPANPTGGLIPAGDMTEVLDEARKLGILCVVDEAFMDFVEKESVKDRVEKYDKLIVLRSMTKFFALAGLRAGYVFAGKRLIEEMRKGKEPWTLNRLGAAAAIASLKDTDFRERTLRTIEVERAFLYEGFASLPFIKTYPSGANFILLRLINGVEAGAIQKKLLAQDGILVRDCWNYRGLEGQFIRVAVRKREDNMLLLEALKRACG